MNYHIGMIIEGEVTGIQPYGAFVALDENEQGLIHISEVKHGYIKNIADILTIGEKVKVQIIDIDEYTNKISLSLRTLEEKIPLTTYRKKKYFTNRNKKIGFTSLEKQMPKWIDLAIKELTEK